MNSTWKLAFAFVWLLPSAALAAPQITAIVNAASYTRSDLPNSAIAPGSLFVVLGEELGPTVLQQANAASLPRTLAGTSIRVTVETTTVDAILVYTSAKQVAAILPSDTPVGIGLLAVTSQGHTSQSGAFQIQHNAPGIFTQNQSGSGFAVAQNFNSETDQPLNRLTRAAHPGQVVTLWATGLGPINGDDAVPPIPQNLDLDLQALVGGKPAKVRYNGRSGCCAGVDEVILEVPSSVEGCDVPVVLRIGSTFSNFATIAVAAAGDVCTDLNGVSGTDIEKFQGGGEITWGHIILSLAQDCGDYYFCTPGIPVMYDESVWGYFVKGGVSALSFPIQPRLPALGSCLVLPANPGPVLGSRPVLLDAGPVFNFSGPKGKFEIPGTAPGQYFRQLSSLATEAQYLQPGDYVVDNGAGGADVGPFRAALTIPKPFSATMQQSQGAVSFVWSGGNPSGYATISGVGVVASTGVSVGFLCAERVSAGQFTVPPEVVLSLPQSRITSSSASSPVIVTFRAQGLDVGQVHFYFAMN